MPDKDPECETLLEQTQESLRAMKLHIVNYQLQMLLFSLRNPVGNSDSPRHENGRAVTSRNVSTTQVSPLSPDNFLSRNSINVKPAVGFTLPSAGVTPAPSVFRQTGSLKPARGFGRVQGLAPAIIVLVPDLDVILAPALDPDDLLGLELHFLDAIGSRETPPACSSMRRLDGASRSGAIIYIADRPSVTEST